MKTDYILWSQENLNELHKVEMIKRSFFHIKNIKINNKTKTWIALPKVKGLSIKRLEPKGNWKIRFIKILVIKKCVSESLRYN